MTDVEEPVFGAKVLDVNAALYSLHNGKRLDSHGNRFNSNVNFSNGKILKGFGSIVI